MSRTPMILQGPGLAVDLECWNAVQPDPDDRRPDCDVSKDEGRLLRVSEEETDHKVTIGLDEVTNVAPNVQCPECRAVTKVSRGSTKRAGFAGLTGRGRQARVLAEESLTGVVVDIEDTAHEPPPGDTAADLISEDAIPEEAYEDDWYVDLLEDLATDPSSHVDYHSTLSRKTLPCPVCGPDNPWM